MKKKSFWNADNDTCNIGKFFVQRIIDLEHVPFTVELVYPDANLKEIKNLSQDIGLQHFSDNLLEILLSFHSFLIQTEKHNILVDTCCGNNKERPTRQAWHQRNGPFLNNLTGSGVTAFDIDFVLCTHLHADHVGWNTKLVDGKWVPTFPNAQYIFSQKEFEYWKTEDQKHPSEPIMYGSYNDSVLPVIKSGQALLVKSDYQIESGIELEPAYGHTPGNIVVNVESEGEQAILCGDVIHHPLQLLRPMWSTNFCHNPELSRQTRLNVLNRCADTQTAILPAHFHSPSFGYIGRVGNTYHMIK
ncbi:MAG: MBL fold metallo-hydrolase [Pseudomonadota bacterium]|nr:MBL fold metallo-hydrolase [Pseudomonadota bacterium]